MTQSWTVITLDSNHKIAELTSEDPDDEFANNIKKEDTFLGRVSAYSEADAIVKDGGCPKCLRVDEIISNRRVKKEG